MAAFTLALVVARPWGLNEGIAALIGAAAVLVLGIVTPSDALHAEAADWNVFLFFLGMMAIAAIADQSGVLDRSAAAVAALARGRVLALYLAVFLLGAGIALLFANDSAALVLTPIVYALVVRLALDPIPFVFATTFIADTASIGLPVSNPLNIILVDGFHLGLRSYISHLWLPAVLAISVNLIVFCILYRDHIRGRIRAPLRADEHPFARSTAVLLALLAAAYLAASTYRLPLGVVAVIGAAVLGLDLARQGHLEVSRIGREIGWPIFGFIAGMLLVVQGLDHAGATASLGRLLADAAGGSDLATIAAATAGTAIGSNIINNLPMGLMMVPAIHAVHVSASTRREMIYGTIVGCDLGPNLTHLGSLATFIWLFFLRRKGLDVSAWDYLRVGIVVTPLMLAATVLGLWVTSAPH